MAVGDYVNIILNQEGTAFISEIEDRKNYIIRRASNLSKQSHILAANLDQCMLIVTVNYPETSTTFIDRFLASAEAYRVPVKIIFNKVDAYNEEELHYLDSLINLYTTIGYPCFKVSARKGEGIDTIEKELKGRITLFSGHSGVGKSTLIKAILPDIEIKTGEISTYHNKGMHTTTFSEMFPVPGNGYIIDTPGIKGFGTFDMEEEEIGHCRLPLRQLYPPPRTRMRCTRGCREALYQRIPLRFLSEHAGGQGGGKIPGCLLICHFITFPIHILTLFNSLSFKLFSFPVV